jgi:predicted nucleic acid-binding protein
VSVYFFDSSAIVKRYVKETGTGWILNITDPAKRNRIYVARITGVEVVSAIARRGRNGDIPGAEVFDAIGQFQNDFSSQYRVLEITPALTGIAMVLAQACALRGYDAIQLAAALEYNNRRLLMSLPALILVSADNALNSAAMAEGLTVDNPNDH